MMDQKKTKEIHEWMKSLDDQHKQMFVINWKIPHTLFNLTCKFKDPAELQWIDWYAIYKSRDLGTWSHGGKVFV